MTIGLANHTVTCRGLLQPQQTMEKFSSSFNPWITGQGIPQLQSPATKFIKSCKITLPSSSSQLLQRFLFVMGLRLDLQVANSSLQMVMLCCLVWRVFASCQLPKNHREQVTGYHCGPHSHFGQPLFWPLENLGA